MAVQRSLTDMGLVMGEPRVGAAAAGGRDAAFMTGGGSREFFEPRDGGLMALEAEAEAGGAADPRPDLDLNLSLDFGGNDLAGGGGQLQRGQARPGAARSVLTGWSGGLTVLYVRAVPVVHFASSAWFAELYEVGSIALVCKGSCYLNLKPFSGLSAVDTLVCVGCRRRARQGCEGSALLVNAQHWSACPAIHGALHVLCCHQITLHVNDDG